MASDAVELADSLIFTVTGRHLNDLQRTILRQVYQGRKYLDIAHKAGYTEGHIKDVASQLWKVLSKVTGERITKATLKSALERYCTSASSIPQVTSPRFSGAANSPRSGMIIAELEPPEPSEASDVDPDRMIGVNVPKSNFVGRQEALTHLQTLVAQGQRAIVIQGEGGLGKTTLAQHFVEHQRVDVTLELLMAKDTADITPVEWVVEEWLRQDFGVEPGREFGVTLDRLKRHLRQQRVAVLIDNLEPCLNAQGLFIQAHRRYRELLRVLTDVRSQAVTVITSRDRICEPGLPITHYRLPGLDVAAWNTYFNEWGIAGKAEVLTTMHGAYGGNAKAMEILCAAIQADFEGNMVAYWQVHSAELLGPVDLKNLVESQIHRLAIWIQKRINCFADWGCFGFRMCPRCPSKDCCV